MSFNLRDLEDIKRLIEQQLVATPHVNRCWLLAEHWPCRERLLVQDLEALHRTIADERARFAAELAGKDAVIAEVTKRNDTLQFRLDKWRAAIAKSANDSREAAEQLQEL